MCNWVRILLTGVVALSYGCATTVSTPALNDGRLAGASDIGVVLVSVGMHEKEPLFSTKHLPIINYDVFSLNPDGTITGSPLMTFSGEPWPEVYFNLRGNLDDGKYGFIHLAELPAGKYVLAGWRHKERGYAMAGVGTVVTIAPGTPASLLLRYLVFDVKACHLNYIGEILTVNHGRTQVNDQFARDFKFAQDNKPQLKQRPVVKQLAR